MSTDPEIMTGQVLLEPHPRLGRYQLHMRVGMGGMAEVFLAREAAGALDRWVAIKRVNPHLARQKRFVQMLLDEARLAARIAHPNVAQVLDLGEDEGVPYIVMEYLHGRPLSAVIRRAVQADASSLDFDLMARIIAHAAEGAHAAHELRSPDGGRLALVHRDLSPHNIFVTYDGSVKVVDFGIAKAKGRATMTEPGTLKGKFSYMSPEQARGGSVDRRSDVYALGLVLYEATTGQAAFQGEDREVLEQAERSQFERPSRIRRPYPAPLEAIVLRALAAAREDRYPTAREMAQALERFIVGRQAVTDPAQIAGMMGHLFPDRGGAGTSTLDSNPSIERPPTTSTVSAAIGLPKRPLSRTRIVLAAAAGFVAVLAAITVLQWSGAAAPALETSPLPPLERPSPSGVEPVAVAAPTPAVPVQTPVVSARTQVAQEEAAVVPARTPVAQEEAPVAPAQTVARAETPVAPVQVPIAAPERNSEIPPATQAGRTVAPAHRRSEPGPARSGPAADPTEAPRTGAREGEAAPPPALTVGSGTLDVHTDPWSMVSIDGRSVQATPLVGLPLRAGPHVLRLVAEDGRTKQMRVQVSTGRTTTIRVRF